ncbi:MAG: phospho-N-acetylmuramoyl-pentapeptide-transferase [Clostridia bacterium]|nr:phospho-N-acetylmuramoyl-pentapeptide-transferase [Clostridia bacterium]
MHRMIMSLLLSLFLVLISGKKIIAMLRKLHFGQTIYDLAPEAHKSKQGTPIMGGLMVAGAVLICALLLHPRQWNGKWDFMLALLAVSFLSMLVGFADDFTKAVLKRSMGLTGWQKIFGQVFVATAFTLYCYFNPYVGSKIVVPLLNVEWDLGIWYIPLMILTIIFMVNSANLQDGLDGLLSSVSSVGSAGWGLMALFFLQAVSLKYDSRLDGNYYSIAIFAMALCGAEMGFMRFNHYPAKVFMGDTGSMFVGGAMVGMALLLRQPLMLLLINFTMVMSSASVIIQRTYFKLTHGKRIFKMSPIHHHFELCGYTETEICTLYATVTAVLSLIAILSLNGLRLV